MHALILWVESLVAALAIAAFAHFGVALKQPRPPNAEQVIRKVAVAGQVSPQTNTPARPCPLAQDARRI